MDKQIKEFVELCQIREQKERLLNTKQELFKLERKMANLAMDYEVGTFIHLGDEYEELRNKKFNATGDELSKLIPKMQPIIKRLQRMKENPKVKKYLELQEVYYGLLDMLGDYAKSINVDFRESVSEYKIPSIYVFQGYFNNDKTMIETKNIVQPEIKVLFTRPTSNTIIHPITEITSKRDLRHFYNKISFKYLEAMTNDYDYGLVSKKLGRVAYIGRMNYNK